MNKIPTAQERLDRIVDTAYEILCGKVASGSISIDNEAALQLQLSVILEQLGRLYELAPTDRFSISLEKVINNLSQKTTKSPNGKARCDIMLQLQDAQIAIELKCFIPDGNTTEPVTENRFKVLCDIENLEQYRKDYGFTGYEIVYTNNKNHTNSKSIGENGIAKGVHTINKNQKSVMLKAFYQCKWDEYSDTHFFLKIKV